MIFVLGGKGFLGSAFVRACQAAGHETHSIDKEEYASYAGRRCRILINANGNSSKVLATKEPLADFDASVRSVRASLEDFPCDLYVYVSSCDVYPDCSSPALTGEDRAIGVNRQSPYGFHKYIAEQCVRHRAAKWLITRQGGMVGPGLRKNAIFDIVNGRPLWLDPESELQFIHTADVASTVLRLAASGETNGVFNLCGSGVVKLGDVMAWVGPVEVSPGAPKVRYEVSVEKISRIVPLPETRKTVYDFVKARVNREAG